MNNPLLYSDPSGNSYIDGVGNTYINGGKDEACVYCGDTKQQIDGSTIGTIGNFFKDPNNTEWSKRNAGETGQFIGRNVQEAANFVGRNIESIGRGIGKLFGFGGGDGPPPNLSSYVNLKTAKNFAQGFGKMGVQTPTESQQAGYYSAMAIGFYYSNRCGSWGLKS